MQVIALKKLIAAFFGDTRTHIAIQTLKSKYIELFVHCSSCLFLILVKYDKNTWLLKNKYTPCGYRVVLKDTSNVCVILATLKQIYIDWIDYFSLV